MKIRTIEDLEDRIVKDLSWRKKEMKNFDLYLKGFGNSVINDQMILRSAISILCAHWEGFIRSSSNYYIVYVINQKKTFRELNNCFAAIYLQKKIKNIDGNTIKPYFTLIEEINDASDEVFFMKFKEPNNRIIKTDGNLSYSKLEDIFNRIGLINQFEANRTQIEEELLSRRHAIVHGEKVSVDKAEYLNVYELVLKLMENFKDIVIEAAENKRYLRET